MRTDSGSNSPDHQRMNGSGTHSSTLWSEAAKLEREQRKFVVVTMVASRGGAPQDPGAKAIVTSDGLHWGTVGGGKVEARAIEFAKERLVECEGAPVLKTWNLQRDIGMSCGGEATFLFEVHHQAAWRIAVFGAGHVSQAVVRALLPLTCHITCIDTRKEWLDRLPDSERITRVRVEDPALAVERFDERTYFVVMTQGHATDRPILQEIFNRAPRAAYVGVMGSEVKGRKIRHELSEYGVDAEFLDRLHCPIGLRLGGNSPPEIAVSVVAELLQVRGSH